ncbi:MAG: bifunctional oligoribonuclease/PAP phosphatase NrnA [Bradymonadales bacterium]|jgi:phosphoesterase RecJ-like protein
MITLSALAQSERRQSVGTMYYQLLDEINPMLQNAAAIIKASQRVLVSMHCRPDGDAAGSAIAMLHLLKALNKEVTLFNVDEIPANFAFLQGAEECERSLPQNASYDLLIVVDCAEPRLLGKRFPQDLDVKKTLYIDHHSVPYVGADVILHSAKASAAGELIFHLFNTLAVPITIAVAETLYTSILTDTGSFRYSCTSADCLAVSSVLVGTGLDVWRISSFVYENNPVEKLKLLGMVLPTLWISEDGRLASLHATRDMLRACRCSGAMTDGFINYARSVAGVEVSIFLTQLEEGSYRLSFRSRGNLDVSLIAASFGGGGHKNAAACTVDGDLEDIRQRVQVIIDKIPPNTDCSDTVLRACL